MEIRMRLTGICRGICGGICARVLGTALIGLAFLLIGGIADLGHWWTSQAAAQSGGSVRPPASANKWAPSRPGKISPQGGGDVQKGVGAGNLPKTTGPQQSQPRMWRDIRRGIQGKVSIPNQKAGYLIQSQGQMWRELRNTKVFKFGAWLLAGTVAVLFLFFIYRRRIPIDGGESGRTLERFNNLERFAHWLTATSFIILGLTGLAMLYGKAVLIPLIGKSGFASLMMLGKMAHNYLGFAFIVGIVLMAVIWLRQNLPDKYDIPWLLKGGGLITKGHPAARKFNFGQKMIFWSVVIIGGIISYTGVLLLFPESGSLIDMQSNQYWHAVLSLVMIAVIIAHIYIGSLGMKGAFQAMGSGHVDENWAKQHHSAWVDEVAGKDGKASAGGAAE
ncbi:MAG TPA: formate dehydrogenase subunit gamma [Alphaproteobacteria bacterium]|nr:formate dehydrogenase subunit gamma [Alphaproteobacteria bacterium]